MVGGLRRRRAGGSDPAATGEGPPGWRQQLGRDVVAALPAWVVARVLVLISFGLAHLLFTALKPARYAGGLRLRQGLLAWDGEWFHRIATEGYAALPRPSLRYFPLLPALGRGLGTVLAGNVGLALVVLANAFALLAGALLYRLVVRETGDERLARRATWVLALAPPSFVLMMAYTESLAILLAVAAFLALRGRRWWWAALAGYLSGLARPLGVLLSLPAAMEALPGLRGDTYRQRLARLAAIGAPLAGCATYLAWVWIRFGDPLLPYSSQQTPDFRGGFANPLVTLAKTAVDLAAGRFATKNVPHLPWAVLLIVLVVVVCRRWPAPYGAFAAATMLVALSTERLGSLERYVFACFPVLLAIASLTESERVERIVLVLGGVVMTVYATLAFLAIYVP